MSFFRVQTQHHLANTPDSCKVSLTKLSGRAKDQVGLRLAIGNNVMAALDAKLGDHMEILWGKDEDVGKIMLRKSPHGPTVKKTRESKHDAGYMTFVGIPSAPIHCVKNEFVRFKAEPKLAQAAEWKVTESNGVLITLPWEWFEPVEKSEELKALTAVPMPASRSAA